MKNFLVFIFIFTSFNTLAGNPCSELLKKASYGRSQTQSRGIASYSSLTEAEKALLKKIKDEVKKQKDVSLLQNQVTFLLNSIVDDKTFDEDFAKSFSNLTLCQFPK
ncbi:MAG: hypothetical protein ACOYL6_15830 [Bacteriovoracaceae bacterium]